MHNVHKSLGVPCIHELGFRVAVDDFGTCQSALAHLERLPVGGPESEYPTSAFV
jgi:predicted signal transduction protein with EAL and GGDEF domain